RGSAQILDHRVDVVFELHDLAARVHLNFTREVALGDRGGDIGDGADLGRQVGGEKIDVVGQVFANPAGAGNVCLAAQSSFDTHFARDRGDLLGKDRQRAGHAVDSFRQGGDFA